MKRNPIKPIDTQTPYNSINEKSQKTEIIIQKNYVDCMDRSSRVNLSSEKLQEAIIWSEIIGKPVCKRRKRSYYGY